MYPEHLTENNSMNNNTIEEMESSYMKHELIELCRICEETEDLVDITTEEFSHLNEKLHKIADFEDNYSCWLQFICVSCSMKLEYAFEFKSQCEETYRKLIEQLENSSFTDNSASFTSFTKPYRIHDQDDVEDDLVVESEQIHFEELEIVKRPGQSTNEETSYVLSDDQEEEEDENSYNGYYSNQLEVNCSEEDDITKEVETLPVECDVSVSSSEEILGNGETEDTEKINGNSTCSFCHKTFKGNLDLTDHIEGMHYNRKRHECATCGAKYTHYVSLIRHQQVHVDDDVYSCDICGKIFKTKKYMRAHRKVHFVTFNSTAASLVCKICNHRSQNNNHHMKHLQTHQSDKPHKCIVCGKGFLRKQYLNEHHRMHTGERPFPCNICSYAFRYRTHLSRHLKTHANKKKT